MPGLFMNDRQSGRFNPATVTTDARSLVALASPLRLSGALASFRESVHCLFFSLWRDCFPPKPNLPGGEIPVVCPDSVLISFTGRGGGGINEKCLFFHKRRLEGFD